MASNRGGIHPTTSVFITIMLLAGPFKEWNIRIMTRHLPACVLVAILGLATLVPGCGPDNQKASKIEGTVPTDNLTNQQRRERASGISDPKAAGYNPGTSNRTR